MKKIAKIASLCLMFVSCAYAYPHRGAWPPIVSYGMPPGSYSQTCSSCYMDANNTLNCACADRSGIPHNTNLPAANYCLSVENINGQLNCKEWRRPNRQHRKTVDIEAGPIWNQSDAEGKCPSVCQMHQGIWTGQWNTTVWGQMSVCSCRLW